MADTLQEESIPKLAPTVDTPSRQRQNSVDKDAQEMVITSLRAQVQDLFSQVSELNNKLVKSYDRVSDLEDDLHVASANVRSSSVKISQLELERTQHLSALNTGLLVEKSHVTTELNRLMEKATEEAAQRGQAESARMAIEKDLDDLSATLFGQANSMVAEARYDKHLSERKVEDAERALKSAEEAVQLMQTQMQALQADKEEAQQKTHEMELVVGKGKWIATGDDDPAISWHLINTHAPYQEYLSLIAHLRVLHPTSLSPPAMTTLLQLPLLSRLLTEDSEPTVRLDLAPSLNWLSRRSVLTAIHSGQLTIEPVSATSLFAESSTYPSTTTVAGMNSTHDNISCALCGVPVFPASTPTPASRPSNTISNISQNAWSGSFFKKSLSGSSTGTPTSPTQSERRNSIGTYLNSQVFIFRMASLPTASISSLPIPSLTKSSSQSNGYPSGPSTSAYGGNTIPSQSSTPNNQPTTIYPLCMSGWCLQRLRTTCTLWAFVRTGIVDKVWEEELPPPPPPAMITVSRSNSGEKPPIPPRKRGLWGIASALGERAASWSGDEKDRLKKAVTATPPPPLPTPAAAAPRATSSTAHSLPPPPPTHPSHAQPPPPPPRRMPPPPPPRSSVDAVVAKPGAVPPPLPRRSEGRTRSSMGHLPSPPPEPSSPTDDDPPPAPSVSAGSEAGAETHPNPDLTPQTKTDTPENTVEGVPLSAETPPTEPSVVPLPAPVVPANFPLPDSRPTTPAGPSRAVSPAVVATPPPLPRRAAARVRAVPSRPATPVHAAEGVAAVAEPAQVEAKGGEEVMEVEVEGATEVANEKVKVGEAGEGDGDGVEPSAGTEEKDGEERVGEERVEEEGVVSAPQLDRSISMETSSSNSDVFEDAPTPAESADNIHDNTVDSEADTAIQKDGEDQLPVQEDEDDKATIVERSASEDAGPSEEVQKPFEDDATTAHTVPILSVNTTEEPSTINGADINGSNVPEKSQREQEEEKKKLKEKERAMLGYVGDRTWEEKTWKELVRLREDMFWARVGRFSD